MTAAAISAVTPDLVRPAPSAPIGDTAGKIKKTAGDFETGFLSIMLGQMFQGVGAGEFGGGQGEEMFKSFLMDAMAKQMTRTGGVGLSQSVEREMLKLQGLEG